MQIVKSKLCRGIIIALESYYRTIRKIMGRLNLKILFQAEWCKVYEKPMVYAGFRN